MKRRRVLIPCLALAVIAVAALIAAGARPMAIRTFTLESPNQSTVAVLHPAQTVCEGPVVSPQPIRGVGIWGGSAVGSAGVTVSVHDANTRAVVTSSMVTAAGAGEWTARLPQAIHGGKPLRICLRGDLNTFVVLGSAAQRPDVVMTGQGAGGHEFSLVLLSDRNRSLLTSLALAFSRASLWRPSWVGSWTFWILTVALLGTFGLGVLAVTTAASAEGEIRPGEDDGGEPGFPPAPDGGTQEDPTETASAPS